jgi:hypothetical protein
VDEFEDLELSSELGPPPLIPMIGIFSMLILFLLAGTVIGNATIEVPPDLLLSQSAKGPEMQAAPQIFLGAKGVRFSFSPESYPFEVFNEKQVHPLRAKLSHLIGGSKNVLCRGRSASELPTSL